MTALRTYFIVIVAKCVQGYEQATTRYGGHEHSEVDRVHIWTAQNPMAQAKYQRVQTIAKGDNEIHLPTHIASNVSSKQCTLKVFTLVSTCLTRMSVRQIIE